MSFHRYNESLLLLYKQHGVDSFFLSFSRKTYNVFVVSLAEEPQNSKTSLFYLDVLANSQTILKAIGLHHNIEVGILF